MPIRLHRVVIYLVRCEACTGSGHMWCKPMEYEDETRITCPTCNGHGRIPAEEEIAVVKLQRNA